MLKLPAVAALAVLPAALHAQAAPAITGRWITPERDAVIEIAPCGAATCGKIARFLKTPPEGPGAKDVNNRDPALRSRPILGLPILTNFRPRANRWEGAIYDPRNGKTYRSLLTRDGANLRVRGCLGPFCQAQIWTPAR